MGEAFLRRSDRIFALMQVLVSGIDTDGESFAETATTIAIGKYGASIQLAHPVSQNAILTIQNLRNGLDERFRVVAEVHRAFGSRREWGVEVINPKGATIWGIEFTSPPEGVQPKALLCCLECGVSTFRSVSPNEYSVLLTKGIVSGHCERCDQVTRWKPSEVPPLGYNIFLPPPGHAVEVDRRKARRLRLAMRMRVENGGGESEFVQTIDISKTGASFLSNRRYGIGEKVSIMLPHSQGDRPSQTVAMIVWQREVPPARLYGVRYEVTGQGNRS